MNLSVITVSLYVRYTYTVSVCANTYTRTVGANTVQYIQTLSVNLGNPGKMENTNTQIRELYWS